MHMYLVLTTLPRLMHLLTTASIIPGWGHPIQVVSPRRLEHGLIFSIRCPPYPLQGSAPLTHQVPYLMDPQRQPEAQGASAVGLRLF